MSTRDKGVQCDAWQVQRGNEVLVEKLNDARSHIWQLTHECERLHTLLSVTESNESTQDHYHTAQLQEMRDTNLRLKGEMGLCRKRLQSEMRRTDDLQGIVNSRKPVEAALLQRNAALERVTTILPALLCNLVVVTVVRVHRKCAKWSRSLQQSEHTATSCFSWCSGQQTSCSPRHSKLA